MMLSDLSSARFVPLNCHGERGSQQCKASLPFLEKYCPNIRTGEYACLCLGEKTVICSVHSEYFPSGNTVQYDDTVTVCGSDTAKSCCSITALRPTSEGEVCVTVVAQELEGFKRWTESDNVGKIEKMCHDCLFQRCIVKNSFVNLKNNRLGKVFGISGIYINAINVSPANDSVLINYKSRIRLERVVSEERYNALNSPTSAAVGGLEKEKAILRELLTLSEHYRCLNLRRPCRVLICGPPGCGKTSLVASLAAESQAVLVAMNGTEVLGPRPGESEENLQAVFRRARSLAKEGPCILLIDELDAICPAKGGSSAGNVQAVMTALMTELDAVEDADGLLVVAATNRPSALNPAMRRPGRLDKEILLSVPDNDQRLEILKIHASALPLADDVDLIQLSALTNGFVGADIAGLCREAAQQALYRVFLPAGLQTANSSQVPSESRVITRQDFLNALKLQQPLLQKGTEGIVSLKKISWDDIGGLQDVKSKIKQAVEWPLKHPEAFLRLGLRASQGVLLYGPPGCSKTTLVRAAASSAGFTFLTLSGAQLYSPFLGDSERLLTETFQKARALAPSILFLDELDAIVGKRSGEGRRGAQERLLSTLLNEMDGIGVRLDDRLHGSSAQDKQVEGAPLQEQNSSSGRQVKVNNAKVLVVAATNRPDLVDDAILRPGRIDSILYVPPPDTETRREILKVHTRNVPLVNVNLDDIAKQTEFYTGADLENVCREAAMFALCESLDSSRVEQGHFVAALQTVRPSLTPDLVEKYRQLKPQSYKRQTPLVQGPSD